MKLLKEVAKSTSGYARRLERIAEKVEQWAEEISNERRIGLPPMSQIVAEADPYNNNPTRRPAAVNPDDTINFSPTRGVQKPVQEPSNARAPAQRIHLVYDPASGEVKKVLKTPLLSRPPAEYMEATAEQLQGAIKHLERINPQLATALSKGSMSVWIPRSAAGPHLGKIAAGTSAAPRNNDNNVTMNMSPEDLAKARRGAESLSLADK